MVKSDEFKPLQTVTSFWVQVKMSDEFKCLYCPVGSQRGKIIVIVVVEKQHGQCKHHAQAEHHDQGEQHAQEWQHDQGGQNFQEEQHGQGNNMLKKSSMTRGSSMLS